MRRAALLALAATAVGAPAPAPAPGTVNIPYHRRSTTLVDGTVDEHALFESLSRTLVKYHHAALPSHLLSKRATGTVPLTDQVVQSNDKEYYGPSTIGHQSFALDFDTGSADVFIPGPACTSANGCSGTAHYSNSGQDQHKTTTVIYGSGQISGEDYKDKVTVGGLTVPSQGFISLTDASGFEGFGADGLMGLAFSTIAQTGYPTFVENLIAQGALTQPQFSFFLGRSASNTQASSELVLGGADSSRFCGTPKTVPVSSETYWQVALDSVYVNGKSAGPTTPGQAAIDTGTSIVFAPTAAAAAIFANIPGAVPIPLGSGSTVTLWSYPCNTAAKYIPSIQFGGTQFAINPLDFNYGKLAANNTMITILGSSQKIPSTTSKSTCHCLAGVAGVDIDPTQNLYIVGDVFLKNWYSTYSYTGPSVSFAAARGNNKQAGCA